MKYLKYFTKNYELTKRSIFYLHNWEDYKNDNILNWKVYMYVSFSIFYFILPTFVQWIEIIYNRDKEVDFVQS